MAVSVSDLGTVEDTGTDNQANFSFGSFGSEAGDRYLIALITARDSFSNDFTATAVTIGGVSASLLQTSNPNTTTQSVVAIAAVPTGASGSVVAGWSEAVASDQLCTLLRVTGLGSATPYDTDAQVSDGNNTTLSGTIDCEANGLVIAVAAVSGTRTFTPSLANEAADQAASDIGHSHSVSWEIFASAQTALAVSATPSAIASDKTIAIVALSPVATVAYTLDCNGGSFSLTGQAATLTAQFKADADKGTFTLTGIDAELKQGYGLIAEVGSFTLTGNDVALTAVQSLVAEAGAFTLTGIDAGLSAGYQIAADVGSFTLTGFDAVFAAALSLAAETGAYALTGQDVNLALALSLGAEAGSFTLTGFDAAFAAALSMGADVGAFTLTGTDVDLTAALTITAEGTNFTLTGQAVTLRFSGWANLPGSGDWTTQVDTATWNTQSSGGDWSIQSGSATWTIQPNSGGWTVQ